MGQAGAEQERKGEPELVKRPQVGKAGQNLEIRVSEVDKVS